MSLYRPGPSWQRDDNTPKKVVIDPLAVIYNEGQWKMNKVSPMYNLQYDTVKLKQYASKIRQAVASNVAANPTVSYTVKCEIQSGLKYLEDDCDGLMITVLSSQENIKPKVAYTAILLSWGVCTKLNDATHLPYLMERGEQKLGAAVKASLQTIFDCNIKQFSFTQQQLLHFGFNFLENDTLRNNEHFTLTYKSPEVDLKEKMKISFDIEDVKIIWNGIKEEVTKRSELINMAYQILKNQIFHMKSLDISVFDLYEVALPKAEVKYNGIVKMKTPELVNCVFTILNEISDIQSTEDLHVST